ncbi:MAG: hypothetical protein ACTSRG_25460 [Candidatus Helarchaeota archaeon]
MRPLIFDFCESVIKYEKPPYFFDENLDINVILLDNGKIIPFIDFDSPGRELETKTKVEREHDYISIQSFLELVTKTRVEREREDE